MNEPSDPKQMADPKQVVWAILAIVPFLISIGLLGFALNNRVLLAFAIGWPALQVFGYVGSLKIAKGDLTHYLFKSQVMLNYMVLTLLIAIFAKVF